MVLMLSSRVSADITIAGVTPARLDTTWASRDRWNELKDIANVAAKITSLKYMFQAWYNIKDVVAGSDILVMVSSYASALGRACQLLSALDITSIGRGTIQPVADCCLQLHEWLTAAHGRSKELLNPDRSFDAFVERLLEAGARNSTTHC